jgi:hypothetical protein
MRVCVRVCVCPPSWPKYRSLRSFNQARTKPECTRTRLGLYLPFLTPVTPVRYLSPTLAAPGADLDTMRSQYLPRTSIMRINHPSSVLLRVRACASMHDAHKLPPLQNFGTDEALLVILHGCQLVERCISCDKVRDAHLRRHAHLHRRRRTSAHRVILVQCVA